MKRFFTQLSITSTIVFALAGAARARLEVVTTIPDFGAIAVEVGGPHVRVTALVKPTQDPHFVDARPSLMVDLNRADLLLVTGMELESGWLPPLMTGSRNPEIQRGADGYLDCSTLIKPMDVRTPDRAKGDIHPGGNPHYWTDPRNGLAIARGIARRLIELDAAHEKDYRRRLQGFVDRLQARMAEWEKRLSPYRGTRVVVYHESWVYFLDWAGFVQAGALEPKPGIPPRPSHVATLIQRVRGQNVRYVIQESFYPTNLSKIFAKKSGATLKVLPTMVGAGGTHTYFDVIERLVEALTS
jgi:zinc/manganese transport system substrate-binding protein